MVSTSRLPPCDISDCTPDLAPSPPSSDSRPHVAPLTAHAPTSTTQVDEPLGTPFLGSEITGPTFAYTNATCSRFFFTLLASFSFVFLALTVVTTFAFQYVVLPFGLWRLDSFSRPYVGLRDAVIAAKHADTNTQVAANAAARRVWRAHCRSVEKELGAEAGLCALILT